LADGVTAGGQITGQARTLSDALARRGLECSVRFTGADGGQTGCFTFREAGRTASEVVYQYRPDGTIIGLNIKVAATESTETAPGLRALVNTVAPIVFPADRAKVTTVLQAWGGWAYGSWGDYEIVSRGPKTLVIASKADTTPIKVPVVHLDTAEAALAEGLRADGFRCARDDESCRSRYAAKGALTVTMSGPDTGITYLAAAASDMSAGAERAVTEKAFTTLLGRVFGHVQGSAVTPFGQWLEAHWDGRSHTAFVAGWRLDLQLIHGTTAATKKLPTQVKLTIFNEEVWQVPM
jgi:hypothetical protein